MALQDVQAVSLDIMKHLHAFCEEHHIKYSLGYGSLIGSVRHKGFIPWDDDLDVVMMREDFDRFCEVFKDTPEYKLFSFNRGNTYSAVARLCDMKRTYVKPRFPLFTEKTGLWVDIFPFDTVEKEKAEFDKRKAAITKASEDTFFCRWQMREYPLKEIRRVRTFWNWIKHVRGARKRIWKLIESQIKLCTSIEPQDSPMMNASIFPTYIDRDYCPKNVFDEVVDAPFEDVSFKIMKGYDEWLTIIYGDYMTPPPPEKQTRGHTIHSYYWK